MEMQDVLFWMQCLYFFFPAYVANTVPLVAARFRLFENLAVPIDGGRNWLGPHKTVRGFLLGSMAGILVVCCQTALASLVPFELSLLRYTWENCFLLGITLGFWSLVGDSIGSFCKRRLRKQPGEHAWLLDELSITMGVFMGMAVLFPAFSLRKLEIAIAFVLLTFIWHVGASQSAYLLRLRGQRW